MTINPIGSDPDDLVRALNRANKSRKYKKNNTVTADETPLSSEPVSEKDGASVSSLAKTLSDITEVLDTIPVVDAHRVQEIRDAIANGQLAINSENIADSLLKEVRELLKAN